MELKARISADLHAAAKIAAHTYGTSLNQFVVKAIEQAVWATQHAEQARTQAHFDVAKDGTVTQNQETLRTKSGHVLTDEEVEGFAAEDEQPEAKTDVWGEPLDPKHVHRCDTLVPDSEFWEKGTRWAQFRCECGKTIAKRHQKKAM